MNNNIKKGEIGESAAANYLASQAYTILERNYRTKIGEIDIIAVKKNILVFVEVKARTSINYGYPYEAVNNKKWERIYKSSLIYIKYKKIRDYHIRYDIIEVYLGKKIKINHLENAYYL